MVYMLAEYPEVLRRLRAEVLEKVGPHRRSIYDDFREMKYMKAVINGRHSTCFGLPNLKCILRTARNAQALSSCVSACAETGAS